MIMYYTSSPSHMQRLGLVGSYIAYTILIFAATSDRGGPRAEPTGACEVAADAGRAAQKMSRAEWTHSYNRTARKEPRELELGLVLVRGTTVQGGEGRGRNEPRRELERPPPFGSYLWCAWSKSFLHLSLVHFVLSTMLFWKLHFFVELKWKNVIFATCDNHVLNCWNQVDWRESSLPVVYLMDHTLE